VNRAFVVARKSLTDTLTCFKVLASWIVANSDVDSCHTLRTIVKVFERGEYDEACALTWLSKMRRETKHGVNLREFTTELCRKPECHPTVLTLSGSLMSHCRNKSDSRPLGRSVGVSMDFALTWPSCCHCLSDLSESIRAPKKKEDSPLQNYHEKLRRRTVSSQTGETSSYGR
jgi:hypothetical protein